MKKPGKHGNKLEKSPIAITATLVDADLLQSLVEKLAGRRYDIGYGRESVQPGWKAIETSSIEAYVSCEINLSGENDLVVIPFTTSFIFTCVKGKDSEYRLCLVQSLS